MRERTPNLMKQLLDRPQGKVGLGIAIVALIAIFAGAFYVFGGNGARTSTTGAVTAPTLAPTGSGKVFTIDSSGSEASFTIDEVLFGQQNTVVGTTSQVAGQIQVDKDDPSKSQVGQIKVDLTGLTTDSALRNRTIQGRILETGDSSNQFAVFTPKSISGLPESVTVGQAFSFKIIGDLTIHGVTRSATFDTTATLESDTKLTGQAQTTIKYKDFDINIPDVPSVSGVSDTVKLALNFTANS
jgi:polyisoprenoid-binding protein YceI